MTPENQLNLRARHPNFQSFLDINEKESDRVRTSYPCHLDERYGEAPLQTLDVFPSSQPNAPIFIFIHGGYWRALDKRSYSFVAEPFIQNNITVCVINYRLLPTVYMQTQLSDIATALESIQANASKYNGNPDQLVLCGHSAGGHLALMTYLMNDKLRSSIRALCSLSGIFDLSPIKNSYLNEELLLSDPDVENYSVTNKDLSVITCPVMLGVGADETDFFISQSRDLHNNIKSTVTTSYHEYPGLNHYQIAHQLGQPDSHLVKSLLKAMV